MPVVPGGKGEVDVMPNTVRVIAFVGVCAGLLASETWTVKLELPVPVGVPLMTPAEDNESPVGRAPVMIDQA